MRSRNSNNQLSHCHADIADFGGSSPAKKIDPYILAVSIFAVACLAVAGTAVALYLEVPFIFAHKITSVVVLNVSAQGLPRSVSVLGGGRVDLDSLPAGRCCCDPLDRACAATLAARALPLHSLVIWYQQVLESKLDILHNEKLACCMSASYPTTP